MNTLTVDGTTGEAAERAAVRALVAEADADAAKNWHDPEWRRETAADITQTVYLGFQHENIVSQLAMVENAGVTDRITVSEVKGLDVYWVSMGGQIDASQIEEQIWELPRDYVGFHVFELEENMETGFSRTSANLVSLAIQKMDAAVNIRLLRLFQAAIPDNTSPSFISGAGVSLSALNTAITEVRDASLSDTVSIVGRATMIDQVMNAIQASDFFTPTTNEEILRLGVLGTYRGANIIRLRNFRDSRNKAQIPNNEMYVVGQDAAKVGFWGGLRAQEWSEQGGWYWHYMGRRMAGFALRRADFVRRIVDTSITNDAA